MADLFTVQVMFGGSAVTLQYDHADPASTAYELVRNGLQSGSHAQPVEITDEYGMKVTVAPGLVAGLVMMHVNRQLDGQRAGQLLGQRAQAQLQDDIATDPVLKLRAARPSFMGNPQMQRG